MVNPDTMTLQGTLAIAWALGITKRGAGLLAEQNTDLFSQAKTGEITLGVNNLLGLAARVAKPGISARVLQFKEFAGSHYSQFASITANEMLVDFVREHPREIAGLLPLPAGYHLLHTTRLITSSYVIAWMADVPAPDLRDIYFRDPHLFSGGSQYAPHLSLLHAPALLQRQYSTANLRTQGLSLEQDRILRLDIGLRRLTHLDQLTEEVFARYQQNDFRLPTGSNLGTLSIDTLLYEKLVKRPNHDRPGIRSTSRRLPAITTPPKPEQTPSSSKPSLQHPKAFVTLPSAAYLLATIPWLVQQHQLKDPSKFRYGALVTIGDLLVLAEGTATAGLAYARIASYDQMLAQQTGMKEAHIIGKIKEQESAVKAESAQQTVPPSAEEKPRIYKPTKTIK